MLALGRRAVAGALPEVQYVTEVATEPMVIRTSTRAGWICSSSMGRHRPGYGRLRQLKDELKGPPDPGHRGAAAGRLAGHLVWPTPGRLATAGSQMQLAFRVSTDLLRPRVTLSRT